MAFNGHWGQDPESENDFMNMMPDFDNLLAHGPAISSTPTTSLSQTQGSLYGTAFDNGPFLSQNPLQQSSSQHLDHDHSSKMIDPSLETSMEARKADTREAFDENLSAWGLDTRGRTVSRPGVGDDAASCSSSCVGSCPSHCGVDGQGQVCVDDDCVAQEHPGICCADDDCGVDSLCVDEACEAAHDPCTDVKCISDVSLPMGTRAETAAAAALTSFGDNSSAALPDFSGCCSHLHPSFGNEFHFGHSHSACTHHAPELQLDRMGPPFNGTGMRMDTTADPAADYNFQEQFWQENPGLAFASHIFHYHDPNQSQVDHSQSCIVDNPNLALSRCTLPVITGNDGLDFSTFLNTDSDYQCGFPIQDPVMYHKHVLTQHRTLLSHIPGFAPCINTGNLVPTLDTVLEEPQTSFNTHTSGLFSFNFANDSIKPRAISTSVSSGTNASVRTSPMPTPDTIATPPPPGDGNSKLSIFQKTTEASEGEVEGMQIDQDDAYQCFWKDPGSGKVCLKHFNDSEELDAHCRRDHVKSMQRVDGGYPCMWQHCKREHGSFSQRGKLNRHLQVHTGLKPTECPVCGVKLSAKQALDQHMRLHTNECPYVCDWPDCNRVFKQRSALTMHYRTHTGEKPLKCDVCGAMFRESSNLTKHRRIHNDKGMYECDICKRDFNRLDQLRRHLNSNHKDMPEAVSEALKNAKPVSKQANVGRRHARHARHRTGSSSAPSPTGVPSTSPEPLLQGSEQHGFLDEMATSDTL